MAAVLKNAAKERLDAGELALGVILRQARTVDIAPIMKSCGYDWLFLDLEHNSDDFLFDNQMLAQSVMFGFRIGEISCPTSYFEEASSIGFKRSMKYGLGVLTTTACFVAHKAGFLKSPLFDATGRKVALTYYSEIAH